MNTFYLFNNQNYRTFFDAILLNKVIKVDISVIKIQLEESIKCSYKN